MAGKRKNNPAGSTNSYRGDVLRVLGALKVATADQIQRIGAPHLTFRHADKETPSKQKQARTASHTGALSDMRKHGLSENGGSTETGDRLRNLTTKGLEAASYELQRPVTEMGSTARGAGSSGASHPMAVNETLIAMLRPKPNMAKLADDPPHTRPRPRPGPPAVTRRGPSGGVSVGVFGGDQERGHHVRGAGWVTGEGHPAETCHSGAVAGEFGVHTEAGFAWCHVHAVAGGPS
ncbi:hypothetical protein [Streptomyces sp. NPDC057545]|uniref:hypothetical protein n=1 Tax=Streptomyces sp. NPDC057545 TaxID=3346164 RepID=UPI0036B4CD68